MNSAKLDSLSRIDAPRAALGRRHRPLISGILSLLGLAATCASATAADSLFLAPGSTVWDDTSISWSLNAGGGATQAWVPGSFAYVFTPSTVTVQGVQTAEAVVLAEGSVLNASPGSQLNITGLAALDVGPGNTITTNHNPIVSSLGVVFDTSSLANELLQLGNITVTGSGNLIATAGTTTIRNATASAAALFVANSAGSSAVLNLDTGATANFLSDGLIGFAASRPGTLNVSGTNTSASFGNKLFVGNQSNGILTVNSGAVVTVAAGIDIASTAGVTSSISLTNGGTLNVGGTGITKGAGTASMTMTGNSVIRALSSHTNQVNLNMTATGQSLVNRVDTNGFNVTMSGVITGVSQLEKTGAGILKLTGSNAYGFSNELNATIIKGGLIEFGAKANLGMIVNAQSNPVRRALLDGGGLRWAPGNTEDVSAWIGVTGNGGTIDTNGNDLTFASPLATGSIITPNVGPMTKTGAGRLTLNGVVTNRTGATTVNGGSLWFDNLNKVGSGPMTITNGAQVNVTGSLPFNNQMTISGTGSSLATNLFLEFGSGSAATGSLALSGGATASTNGTLAVGNAGTGTITVTGAGSSLVGSSALYNGIAGGSGTITIADGGSITAASLRTGEAGGGTGTVNLNTGGTLAVGGPEAIARFGGTANFNWAGGTLKVHGSNFFSALPMALSNSSTFDSNGFSATLAGALNGSGSLSKVGAGTLTLTSSNTIGGSLAVNGGTLSLAGVTLAVGTSVEIGGSGSAGLSLAANSSLSAVSGISFGVQPAVSGGVGVASPGAVLSTGGLLTVGVSGIGGVNVGNGGTVTAGALLYASQPGSVGNFDLNLGGTLNVGGINGIAKGAGGGTFNLAGGLLKVTNSSLTTSVPMVLSNVSTIDTSGETATLSGVLGDAGGIIKTGGGVLYLTAANTYAGGTQVIGGQISVPSGLSLGVGPVTITGGSITSTATFSRNHTVSVSGASSALTATSFIEIGDSGTGSLFLTGGADATTPSSVTFGVLAGSSGSATVTGVDSLLSSGGNLWVGFEGTGSVTVEAGATVNTGGKVVLGSQASGIGTFTLNPGGTLNVGGVEGILAGAGTASFNLAGGLLKVTGSSLTTPVPMTLANLPLVDTSGVTATLSGTLSGSGGLAKTGGGTLTLGAVNTYAGSTVLFGGTLALGIDGALPDSSLIDLQGGILATNGFSDTTGPLKLSAGTTLDLGLGPVSLSFANSSAQPWNAVLNITGYVPGGDALRFGSDSTGLTPAQLGLIRFVDYGNATGVIDSLGYVTIPEPATGTLLLAATTLLTQKRKRRPCQKA